MVRILSNLQGPLLDLLRQVDCQRDLHKYLHDLHKYLHEDLVLMADLQ